jgi:truncated hemoglobin YjbI
MADQRLGRFWAHRSEDGLKRELQLLINFLCNVTGGPMVYTGRDMKTSHKGMRIDEQDWKAFVGHVNATLDHFWSHGRGSGSRRQLRRKYERRHRRSLACNGRT